MGLSDLFKAFDDYGKKHKEHMTQQWEKQAEKARAAEPRPLTETQRAWQQLQQERPQQQVARQQHAQPQVVCEQQRASAPATPLYTITWQVRLSSLGNIPLPWATN
jgi:uncharacterized protein YllA (UPF0747 family)